MQGNLKIIKQLNHSLTFLLTGINQYFLHARMSNNWGFSQLDKIYYKRSIVLMKESDRLMQRILFLQGLPNLQALGKLYIGENVKESLKGNKKFETELRESLLKSIQACETEGDYISRENLQGILESCEDDIDWLESQQYLIQVSGYENYLQSMI